MHVQDFIILEIYRIIYLQNLLQAFNMHLINSNQYVILDLTGY